MVNCMKYIDAAQTAEMLKSKDNILILTHYHPDGDTLGSAFALCRALRKLGKRARVHNEEAINPKFSFLWEDMEQQDFEEDFVMSVDVAAAELLGEKTQARYADKITLAIDHHSSNSLDVPYIYLEGDSAANAELIMLVIDELGVEIDALTAGCIYTGVSTDTGCFRYGNVTRRSFQIAGRMLDLGADLYNINIKMFETKTKGMIKIEEMVLNSVEYAFGGKCAMVTITQDMFKQTGTTENDCEAISSLPRQIEGVLVGITIKERKNGMFKASVRSRAPVNSANICIALGGGGHSEAAGCRFDGTLERFKEKLLEEVEKELNRR